MLGWLVVVYPEYFAIKNPKIMPRKSTTRTRARTVRKISDLSPTEFENLIFDLLISRGMVNVTWRTPGVDGGRDIEGITVETDFAGEQASKKWFIECKRYKDSVDWPTIYGKLAYADSHRADVLLLCTTSLFTPTAISQVESWNSARRNTVIRLWPRHALEQQLQFQPDICLKYGLAGAPSMPGKSIVELALALSKTVGSHYSKVIFEGATPDLMLQAAQSFSDLLARRMEDIERTGEIIVTPSHPGRALEVCEFTGEFSAVDDAAMSAFVAYLIALSREKILVELRSDNCRIKSVALIGDIVERYRKVFSAIAMWGDFEFDISPNEITLRQRE